MLLSLIQFRIKCALLDNFRVASSEFGEHGYIAVSSAKLQTLNEKHKVIYKKVK